MSATPFSYRTYDGDGSNRTFSVPFPFLLRAHVVVGLGYDTLTSEFTTALAPGVGFTWLNDTSIQTTTAPAVGAKLSVVRQTPTDSRLVQWLDGSPPTPKQLDTADLQQLYATQELSDKAELSLDGAAIAVGAATTATTQANSAAASASTAASQATAAAGSATTAATQATSATNAATTANAAATTAGTAATTATTQAGNASSSATSAAASAALAGTPFSIATTDGSIAGQTTTAAGITLPSGATAPVAVTLVTTNLLAVSSGAFGFLGPTYGLLLRAAGGSYTFTPAAAPGSNITVASGTIFRMDSATTNLLRLWVGNNAITDEPFDDLGYGKLLLGSDLRIWSGYMSDGSPFFNKVGKFLLDVASAAAALNNPTVAATLLSLATPAGHLRSEEIGYADQYDRVWRYSDLRLALALLRTGQVYAPKLRVDILDVGSATGGLSPRTAIASAAGLFQVEQASGQPNIIRYNNGTRAQITGNTSGVGSQNYAPSFTAESPQRILFTSNRRSVSAPGYFVMDVAGAEVYPATPDPDIAVWGDSMSSDIESARLGAAFVAAGTQNPGRLVLNKGVGGNSSPVVAMRMGAIPWTATVASNTIPASGGVTLTNHRTPLLTAFVAANAAASPAIDPDPMTYGSWPPSGVKGCYVSIGGVPGVVTESGGVFTFTRTAAGSSVAVSNPATITVTSAGPDDSLVTLNGDTAIMWPFDPHINNVSIAGNNIATTVVPALEMSIVQAMINKLGSVDKRFVLLYRQRLYWPPSNNVNAQRDYDVAEAVGAAYASTFPNNYFDYVPLFANGYGPIPSFKDWLSANHLTRFNDSGWGWEAPLGVNPDNGALFPAQTEPAAVATITLTGNGGSGVTSTNSVATTTAGSTLHTKAGLRCGVTASGGVATALWVRHGGRGYTVGDTVTIAAGAIGNATAITGTVATTRSELGGIIRDAAGTIIPSLSYSQWDVDNGFIPRCALRDGVHFNTGFTNGSLTGSGSEYLCLLLAQLIKNKVIW